MKIEDLPVSKKVKKVLTHFGLSELYPPQADAITKGKVLDGENLVLSIPTASGKTLIAELAMITKIQKEKGKVIYTVPLKALASEKVKEFREKWEKGPAGEMAKVIQTSSDFDDADNWLDKYDIIVSTNEKADSLFRHNPKWIRKVKLLVIDEIHLIDDTTRGATLEVFIAKMRERNPNIQIVALSATIPNAKELAEWLNANLVQSEWRPVNLREGIYYNGVIYYSDGSSEIVSHDLPSPGLNMIKDTLEQGGQTLVFLPRRIDTVSQALTIGKITKPYLREKDKLRDKITKGVCTQKLTNTILGEKLCKCVTMGSAFHHAGLRSEQRALVELGFKKRFIKTITATPTLAAGVNLPARRVIISHKRWQDGRQVEIKVAEYKQMAGRAGRPGLDDFGESVLLARTEDDFAALQRRYILGSVEAISSKLNDPSALRTHILAYIAQFGDEYVEHKQILNFIKLTFYGYKGMGSRLFLANLTDVINFLAEHGFIEKVGDTTIATKFGQRVAQLYIDPLTAVIIKMGLEVAPTIDKPFNIIGWTHLMALTPNFRTPFIRTRRKRGSEEPSELEQALAFYEKFSTYFLIDPPIPLDVFDIDQMDASVQKYLEALKVVLIVSLWVNEASEKTITEQFNIGPGDLMTYLETYKWLYYSTQEIARMLDYKDFIKPLGVNGWRVAEGVKADILDLTKLRGVGRVLGRRLHDAGFKTRKDLEGIDADQLIAKKIKGIGPKTAASIIAQIEEMEEEEEEEEIEEEF